MDQPVFSFVSHSSLLTEKSVDLVVARDGFLCNGNRLYFAILFAEMLFEQFLIRPAV